MKKYLALIIILLVIISSLLAALVAQTYLLNTSKPQSSIPTPTPSKTPSISDFMQTEQISITNVQFGTGQALIGVSNTGTGDVTISEVMVNGITQSGVIYSTSNPTIQANSRVTITVEHSFVAGNNYQFKLITSRGNQFTYSAIAS